VEKRHKLDVDDEGTEWKRAKGVIFTLKAPPWIQDDVLHTSFREVYQEASKYY